MFSDEDQDVSPEAVVKGPPSTWVWTFATLTLSAAVPEMLTVPETVAPEAGLAIATVGGCVSEFATVIVTESHLLLPAESVARTRIVWLPSA